MAEKDHSQNETSENQVQDQRTLRSLVDTPLKKIMFGIQILSYILIPASPVIGTLIGNALNLSAGKTAGIVLGIFIAGEVLFYGSLAFLGKGLILFLLDKVKRWFRSRKKYFL